MQTIKSNKLFRLTMNINENNLEYSPSLNENNKNSLNQMMKSFLMDVCSLSKKLNKLIQNNSADEHLTYEGINSLHTFIFIFHFNS